MAAFPYQQQPFHLDSLFLSNTAFKMFDLLPERVDTNPNNNNNPTLFPSFQSDSNGCYPEIINEYCLSEKTKSNTDSSSIVDSEGSDQEKIITTTTTSSSMEKKRKHRDGSCMNSTTLDQIKQDGDRAKPTKKQRKINVENLELTKDKKCNKDDKRKKKNNNSKAIKDLPTTTTGYVHVRARRGQATDSHSLAERVRREKISERLKMLQDLVPGCDKVNSKAVMLEEIINYVQSLQHQVEMLSLKLASMNPMVYDFGVDLDAFLVKPEDKLSTLGSPTSSFQHLSSIPIASTTFANGTNNNVPLLDSSSSVSFSHQQDQRLSDYLTHSQGHEDLLWHVGYQRQGFINQLGATNWCSFQ